MAITSTGFGSGLPINDLVSQLVQAEAAPKTNLLNRKETTLQSELTAVGVLKGALSDFQSKLAGLADPDRYTSRSTTTSDSKYASFSAEDEAAIGSYSLEVQNLATAQKLVGQTGFTDGAEGSLVFTNQAGDSFTVDIGTANSTLEGISDAINNEASNFGVTATILNLTSGARLVLTANDTGVDQRITSITSSSTTGDLSVFDYTFTAAADPELDGDGTNWDQVISAANANYTLEGQPLTSATNTIEDVIPNTTLTLKKATEADSPVDLSVKSNTNTIKGLLEGFVKAYNELQTLLTEQTKYNAETGVAGVLQGDAMTRTLQSQLRGILYGTGSGSDITNLTQLGITTDASGKLTLDGGKLDTALSSNYDGVKAFFTDETSGFATRMDTLLEGFLKSDGALSGRNDSIDRQLNDINDQRESLALRLNQLEARLFSQFNAMDTLVAQLNSSGTYLQQQLASIAQITNSKKS